MSATDQSTMSTTPPSDTPTRFVDKELADKHLKATHEAVEKFCTDWKSKYGSDAVNTLDDNASFQDRLRKITFDPNSTQAYMVLEASDTAGLRGTRTISNPLLDLLKKHREEHGQELSSEARDTWSYFQREVAPRYLRGEYALKDMWENCISPKGLEFLTELKQKHSGLSEAQIKAEDEMFEDEQRKIFEKTCSSMLGIDVREVEQTQKDWDGLSIHLKSGENDSTQLPTLSIPIAEAVFLFGQLMGGDEPDLISQNAPGLIKEQEVEIARCEAAQRPNDTPSTELLERREVLEEMKSLNALATQMIRGFDGRVSNGWLVVASDTPPTGETGSFVHTDEGYCSGGSSHGSE